MDEKEIHKILRYKRPSDSWVCPECDTENSLTLGKCIVCGDVKPTNLTILKAWTEADDRPATPPHKKPTSTSTATTSGPVFKDDHTDVPEEESVNKNKIIWGIIIAIIIIGILIAASQGGNASAYSKAMNEFNAGNYEVAITMFEELPSDYKDVSYMIDESKYQTAMQYYDSGDFTTAESLFDSISHHNDSANMVNECKYQTAISYVNSGEFTKAMSFFNKLLSYKDSTSQFSFAENSIIQLNKRNGYFADDYSMIGHWQDSSGNYVTYTRQNDGSVYANYGLSNNGGNHFKITTGIHYHSTDSGGWEKQWIYQRVNSSTVNVYDYIDGQAYTLVKQ